MRAKNIFQTEGLIPLLRQGVAFLIGHFFRYRTYYLYHLDTLEELDEADFMPRILNFTFKVAATNQQADELATDGLDFRSHVINARQRLDKGAIAFCIFIDSELAHISWLAMTEQAKKTLDALPYKVDFSSNEAYTSAVETKPKYRKLGLMGYAQFKILQFLRERSIVVVRVVAARNNIAPQRVYAKLGAKLYAAARYLKILWWKSWKEKNLT